MTIASSNRRAYRNGHASEPGKTIRVAIYTRQSVDRGDEFGSIHAQREAVEAYVLSQRGEGWVVHPESYDDGGYSGATTDRPAFQRLLADIEAGNVDAVAVYRTDRLSRSLLDFARLMEFFQAHRVEFASVTERFDTSTPAGRMVLNLLATFGQYERESIAQRTKDKMLATRRRGMWTGGRPPIGFDLVDKRLVVNEEEANQVRAIFALYLGLGSLLAVLDELRLRGWRSKAWIGTDGKQHGGGAFSKSSLSLMLKSPLYAGKVRAGDELVQGQHEAIVDEATWQAVREQLEQNGRLQRGPRQGASSTALLLGLLKCRCGSSMTTHACKRKGRRYQYYTCMRYVKEGAAACPGSRVSVGELEAFVLDHLRAIGRDPAVLEATLAADREERETRRPELEVQVQQLAREVGRAETERRHLLDAIASGGASAALHARLDEANDVHAELSRRHAQAARELKALDQGAIDPQELSQALLDFDAIWAELFPAERARALALLIERVVFDAAQGEVEIAFRPGGPVVLWQHHGGEQ